MLGNPSKYFTKQILDRLDNYLGKIFKYGSELEADRAESEIEKQIKEYGDKIPADKKEKIETALADLKKAHGDKNLAGIETAMET
jgi:molecular chaperone DnaK (HSP70)